jgi:hypothetical protein
MRDAFAVIVISGALSITLVAAFAATRAPESPCLGEAPQASVARHATIGIVKSIDATTLVIARAGNRGEMTFELKPSIPRQGAIGVGTTVSVRYEDDGTSHVATAVTVHNLNQPATR